ncbi:MAG: hypothetical protein JNK48_22330 [Bryobacterales bacterium]|nr:hypothetical protein [Bryobacterales bacterium]
MRRKISPPPELPDATEPAVACARCESVAVYLDDDGVLVCADCTAVLQLELTELSPGS